MTKFILFLTTVAFSLSGAIASSDSGFETPVMGWSSWNTYRVNISDSLICRQADCLTDIGLDSAGYRYINIDDGFFGPRDPSTGMLSFNPQRFPHGLKPVVDHIHSLGLKAGIYSDAGANTCGSFWDGDSLGVGVGLYGHDENDCNLFFNDLGFDFIKVDFCGGDSAQNSMGLDLDEAQRYSAIRKAIKATGRNDVRLNICRWAYPGSWARDIASSWRTTPDIRCSWESIKGIIADNLYLSGFAGEGHYNDMDMLEVGRTLSRQEDETHFAMWCMMSSPLMIGCDLTLLQPQTIDLLTNPELIAINQDPASCQAYVAKNDNGAFILIRDLLQRDSTIRAVAFYNPTDTLRCMTFPVYDAGLAGPVEVRDIIRRTDMPATSASIIANVPPHGVRIFRLHGTGRLMRRHYEAESAFMPSYQQIDDPITRGTPYFVYDNRFSGGVAVANAGGRQHNEIVWNNVTVPVEGFYNITVSHLCKTPGRFFICADGASAEIRSSGTDTTEHSTVRIWLKEGSNRISIFNYSDIIPVIDCIDIEL